MCTEVDTCWLPFRLVPVFCSKHLNFNIFKLKQILFNELIFLALLPWNLWSLVALPECCISCLTVCSQIHVLLSTYDLRVSILQDPTQTKLSSSERILISKCSCLWNARDTPRQPCLYWEHCVFDHWQAVTKRIAPYDRARFVVEYIDDMAPKVHVIACCYMLKRCLLYWLLIECAYFAGSWLSKIFCVCKVKGKTYEHFTTSASIEWKLLMQTPLRIS